MARMLTDDDVDNMVVRTFPTTPQRMESRRAWGLRAGRASYDRGEPITANPFRERPLMPMASTWRDAWLAADAEVTRLAQRVDSRRADIAMGDDPAIAEANAEFGRRELVEVG